MCNCTNGNTQNPEVGTVLQVTSKSLKSTQNSQVLRNEFQVHTSQCQPNGNLTGIFSPNAEQIWLLAMFQFNWVEQALLHRDDVMKGGKEIL